MVKKILQSPIFNVVLIVAFGIVMLGKYYTEHVPSWMNINPLILTTVIFALILAIPFYNFKNPKNKIKSTLVPIEFKEEDEGLQWITYKATRKVYIFFASFVPIAIALIAFFNHIPYLPIILLIIMAVAQYLIFWYEHKKYS